MVTTSNTPLACISKRTDCLACRILSGSLFETLLHLASTFFWNVPLFQLIYLPLSVILISTAIIVIHKFSFPRYWSALLVAGSLFSSLEASTRIHDAFVNLLLIISSSSSYGNTTFKCLQGIRNSFPLKFAITSPQLINQKQSTR